MNTLSFSFSLTFLLCLNTVLADDSPVENQNGSMILVPVEPNINGSFVSHNKRIRNGQTININQAKYYVYMECGQAACGGTLVRKNKVITAGHCVDSCNANQFIMAVGLNSLSEAGSARKYRATSIKLHPKYNKNNPFPYDVAVITLTENVGLNNKVGLIDYASTYPPLRSSLTIVGYGATYLNGPLSKRLQRAQVKMVQRDSTRLYAEVGKNGPSVLPGDSGGPAVYNSRLTGVISAYQTRQNVIVGNVFVSLASPEIRSFVSRYAP